MNMNEYEYRPKLWFGLRFGLIVNLFMTVYLIPVYDIWMESTS